jgi:DNA-binding transcriptional LysR family regulator
MTKKSLEFRHLEAFRAIMRSGTATGAGAMLGISQPAVSRLLSQAETLVGFPLFERLHGRLVPTVTAQTLHEETERIFTGIEEIAALTERLRVQSPRRVVIASLPTLTLSILPGAVMGWRQAGRRETLSIHSRTAGGVLGLVASRQADIGIAMGSPAIPGVRSTPLARTRGWCVMARGHALAAKPLIRPADLDGQSFIALSREEGRQALIDEAMRGTGAQFVENVECRMTAGAVGMVAAGVGVTITDAFSASLYLDRGLVLRPFEPAVFFDYRLIWPEEVPDTFGRAALAQAIRHEARRVIDLVAAAAPA